MELVEFLLARIGEDEEAARATASRKWDATADFVEADDRDGELPNDLICEVDDWNRDIHGEPTRARAAHIARWDPARVLAECAAKRRLVELHRSAGAYLLGDVDGPRQAYCATCGSGEPYEYPTSWPCETLRLLAAPYADHSDYPEATQ